MRRLHKILLFVFLAVFIPVAGCYANEPEAKQEEQKEEKELNVREFILEHVSDSYVWHITKIGEHEIGIPLPVILYSQTTGWHVFMSSVFHESPVYEGFQIAHEGQYKGKIVEVGTAGEETRPFDISITKNVFSLLFSSILLVIVIMLVRRSYKKNPLESRSGFVGFMEMFIMNINDDVIKPCIGKDYK
jgi:F-type H+-transporting ATPase subunit a